MLAKCYFDVEATFRESHETKISYNFQIYSYCNILLFFLWQYMPDKSNREQTAFHKTLTNHIIFQSFFYVGSHLLSLFVYYGINLLVAVSCVTCTHPSNPYWVVIQALQSTDHWLAVLLVVVLALCPRYVYI